MPHPTELVPVLKRLRLSGLLETLDLRTKEAVDENLSHGEFLLRLCSDEMDRREQKQLDLRLKRANFDGAKRLDDFQWSFNPTIPKAKIIDLATCHFVERHESVLLIGPTGVGKTHVAKALGERACRAGYSTIYVRSHPMFSELRAARADRTYDRKLLRFTGPDLLIVDDLGLRPLEGDEPIDLYEIIRARYERGAMILTSNRALEEWYPLFHDDLMASAAMDRPAGPPAVTAIQARGRADRARAWTDDFAARVTAANDRLAKAEAAWREAEGAGLSIEGPKDTTPWGLLSWAISTALLVVLNEKRKRDTKAALEEAKRDSREVVAHQDDAPFVGSAGKVEPEARLADAPARLDALEATLQAAGVLKAG